MLPWVEMSLISISPFESCGVAANGNDDSTGLDWVIPSRGREKLPQQIILSPDAQNSSSSSG